MQIGEKLPEFTAIDAGGAEFNSNELIGKPCVIYFYPKDETAGCTVQACEFRNRIEEFDHEEATIVGISGDSSDDHASFANHHLLPYTLLSDSGKKLRKLFGVKNDFFFIPGRETFVFDANGILIGKYRSGVNFKQHAEEALKILRTA